MTPSQSQPRTVGVVIVILVAFAVLGLVFIAAWMGALTITPPAQGPPIIITDVKFQLGTDLLTITAKNIRDIGSVNITEVMVYRTPAGSTDPWILWVTVPVNKEIEAGKQASITINCEWTSENTYRVRLEWASAQAIGDWDYTAVAP